MKRILFLLLGLMSLVGLSSCEDKFVYDEEKEFIPLGYLPKRPPLDDEDPESITREVTTLQILGPKGLVVDQIEKDDWKIITPASLSFRGTEPLQLEKRVFEFEEDIPRAIMDVNTNYAGETIPIAFGNTKVMYQYMGQDVELIPLGDVRLIFNVVEKDRRQGEYFTQFGDIEISLMIDYLVVKKHTISFVVLDPRIYDLED